MVPGPHSSSLWCFLAHGESRGKGHHSATQSECTRSELWKCSIKTVMCGRLSGGSLSDLSTTASHNFRLSLYRYIILKNHEMGSQLHLHASAKVCLRYFRNLSFYVYLLWYFSLFYVCKIIQNLIKITFLGCVFPLRVSRASEELKSCFTLLVSVLQFLNGKRLREKQ